MDDLIDRLRHADRHSQQRVLGSRIFGEAADEIERLRETLRSYAQDEHCGLCERLVSSGELARQTLGADHG